MKVNCWKRKVDFLLSRLVTNIQEKELKKKKKQEKKVQRKKELKITYYRALNTKTKIKNTEIRDTFFIYWKDKEIGEYMEKGLPQQILNKFQTHHFHKNMLFVRIKGTLH